MLDTEELCLKEGVQLCLVQNMLHTSTFGDHHTHSANAGLADFLQDIGEAPWVLVGVHC